MALLKFFGFPRKMWKQMAILLGALSTLPLVLLGFLLINTSQMAVRTSVLRDQEQLAIRTAGELGKFFEHPHGLLNSAAAILGTLHADSWQQETALVQLALDDEIFGRISSVDLKGDEIVTSDLGMALRNRSTDPAFAAALQGRFYMSDIYISKEHIPYATMSVPVRQMGKVSGVLIAEVNLRGFWKIVDEIRIGKTGTAFVVSKRGILIADEDKKKVLANEKRSDHQAVRAALAGNTGSIEWVDPAGETWLEAYAPLRELGWGVVVKQSAAEAYSFLRVMKMTSWMLIGVSLLAAIMISVLLSRWLVRPIRLLSDKMHRVADGDLEQSLEPQRKDEIGDLMRAFNQMTEQLKRARESEKLATIGKAAAAIAHELKNSLVLAGAFIGLLPTRHADKKFLNQFSTVVPQELESWKNMLQDISDYSRKSDFELTEVALKELLSNFIFLVEQRLAQHHVSLHLEIPDTLPMIRANAQKLKQVLVNLAMNALEAMPQGGSLTIRAIVLSHQLEIRIEDTGNGIAPDLLGKIFDPFYTTKTQGLGLGLTICREIIKQHGGALLAESRPGAGTVFIVGLPLGLAVSAPKEAVA